MHPGRRLHTTPRRTRFSRFSVCCQKVARSWQTSQPTKAKRQRGQLLRRLVFKRWPISPISMPMSSMPTRAAQPPGGRSSFSFNDGSDARLRLPPANYPTPLRQSEQPPGGRSTWSFHDHSGTGSESVRHTNGLLRSTNTNRVPAGGLSSIDLSDASSQSRGRFADDALHDFMHGSKVPATVAPTAPPAPYATALPSDDATITGHRNSLAPPGGRSSFSFGWGEDQGVNHGRKMSAAVSSAAVAPIAPPAPYAPALPSDDATITGHRSSLAPPGGRSSFSFGWGEDQGVNHHHAYYQRRDAGVRQPPVRDGASHNPTNAAFERAFAADNHIKSIPRARGSTNGLLDYSDPGHGGGNSGYGGGAWGSRPTVHVMQPPGGASSVVFG